MATVELHRSQNNNLTRIYLGDIVLWFSYETIVAFHVPGSRPVVAANVWSNTTGRHLNEIDGGNKSARLGPEDFRTKLDEVMTIINTAMATLSTYTAALAEAAR